MEKIASKQVEGVVDLNSFQRIPARKEFLGGVGAGYGSTGHYPLLSGGFIYWVLDPDSEPQENDYRMGVSPDTRLLTLQVLQNRTWVNACLDGCSSTTTSGGGTTDPGTGGGGTGGGTGGGGLAKKAKLTELGDVQIVSLQDGYVTSKFRFSMEGSPPSNGQIQVKFSAKVLQSDGAFEESAPINQGKPQVLSVTGPIGSTESDTIRISSENWTGELAVLVKAPIECAVVCLDEIEVSAAVKP